MSSPASLASVSVPLACLYGGADFKSRRKKAIICSKACHSIAERTRKGQPPTRMNPRVFDHHFTRVVDPPRTTPERFDFIIWTPGGALSGASVTDGLFA